MLIIERVALRDVEVCLAEINRLLRQMDETRDGAHAVLTHAECREMLGQDHFHLFLIHSSDHASGRKLGMVAIFCVLKPDGWLAEIHTVVVDAPARRRGIGRILVERCLSVARALASEKQRSVTVALTSRPSREGANRLYRRLGFVRVARPVETGKGTNLYRLTVRPHGSS